MLKKSKQAELLALEEASKTVIQPGQQSCIIILVAQDRTFDSAGF